MSDFNREEIMGQAVTQEAALERWCPETRTASMVITNQGEVTVAVNRHAVDKEGVQRSLCMGSRCMHWDWMDADMKHGFCGLSGRPNY